jgi:hypothetical protein
MKFPLFCYYRKTGLLWFRVCGYGLEVKDTSRHRLLFSERLGLVRSLRVGKYFVHFLPKDRIREKCR